MRTRKNGIMREYRKMLVKQIDLHDAAIFEKYIESKTDGSLFLTERQIERVQKIIEKLRGFYEKQSIS